MVNLQHSLGQDGKAFRKLELKTISMESHLLVKRMC